MKTQYLKLAILIVFVIAIQLSGQTTNERSWIDGETTFSHVDTAKNVFLSNSIYTLYPHQGSSSQAADFQLSLSGKDWTWPDKIRIESAEDIDSREFLGSELYLVTDAAGKKVLEINAVSGSLVWEFYGENVDDPRYLGNPVDACSYSEMESGESVRKVLITDEGRHRVIKVIQPTKDIQWSYGVPDVEGSGVGYLSNPADAVPMPDSGKIFICDKGNRRVILVNESTNAIEWTFTTNLNSPVDIDYNKDSGNLLITDQANHAVFLVNVSSNSVVWHFGNVGIPDSMSAGLNFPSDADFLPNGDILICDTGNHRLIEVNMNGDVIWNFGKTFDNLKDADRLPNGKHVIVDGNLPSRIGYTTADFISETIDIGKEVSFLSLLWQADTMAGVSSIKLQLRTENTLGDLASAPWRGPDGTDASYYVIPFSQINPAHNGHRFYQFKAKLITNDPMYTPFLNDVILNYFYYDVNTTGKIVSSVIRDSANYIITRWKKVIFKTVLPENPANRDKVELKISVMDPETHTAIRSFTASNVDTSNEEALSTIVGLENKQAIYLQATFKTNNSSVSPALDYWKVEWDRTFSSQASIQFIDSEYQPTSTYRFSDRIQPGQPYIDRITIMLSDQNLEQVSNSVDVEIVSLISTDHEVVTLNRQTTGGFLLQPSIPGIILASGAPIKDNGFLEVLDRDTLVVTYQDPTNEFDIARDSVLIIENTIGSIFFVDQQATRIDTAREGDTLYVQVVDEFDRNITSNQDTIYLEVYNSTTNDREQMTLVELPDSAGDYNTGNFFSTTGLSIQLKNVGIVNDGILQALGNDQVGINYDDSISPTPILTILSEVAPPEDIVNENSGPLDFDIAPNPFVVSSGDKLQFRTSSSIGTLAIERIEIFSMAGEKIIEIPESQLSIYYEYPIPRLHYGFSKNWWHLRNSNGDLVASGTYFIKISARIIETGKRISKIKKLALIR